MSQHGDLELRLGRCALVRPEHAEDATQQEIEERADHGGALSQIGPPKPLSGHDRVSGPHGMAYALLPHGRQRSTGKWVADATLLVLGLARQYLAVDHLTDDVMGVTLGVPF